MLGQQLACNGVLRHLKGVQEDGNSLDTTWKCWSQDAESTRLRWDVGRFIGDGGGYRDRGRGGDSYGDRPPRRDDRPRRRDYGGDGYRERSPARSAGGGSSWGGWSE